MTIKKHLQELVESHHTYHSGTKRNSALSMKGIPEFPQSNILFKQYSDKQWLSNLTWPAAFTQLVIYTKWKKPQTITRPKPSNICPASKLPYKRKFKCKQTTLTLHDKILRDTRCIVFKCTALTPLNVIILWHTLMCY